MNTRDFTVGDCPAHIAPPDMTTHRCPPDGAGTTPCCNRTPFELPPDDRLTLDDDVVTCGFPHQGTPGHWHVLPEPCDEPTADTALADSICPLCNEPIGYGQRFIDCPEHGLTHRDCWSERYETRPEAYGTPFAEREAVA